MPDSFRDSILRLIFEANGITAAQIAQRLDRGRTETYHALVDLRRTGLVAPRATGRLLELTEDGRLVVEARMAREAT